jgi:2-polyprenyl-3-methyl-5-hydroxy-6-metoxy-1,4-benzoquinol methylase
MDLVEKNQNLHRHPWELSRLDFVKNKITSSNATRNPIVADIGAGDQFFLSHIDNCSKKYAVDIFYEDEFIKDEFVQTRDLGKIPDNSIDQVFLLDVIEHVENDMDLLKEISKKDKINNRKL